MERVGKAEDEAQEEGKVAGEGGNGEERRRIKGVRGERERKRR